MTRRCHARRVCGARPCWICGDECEFGMCDRCSSMTSRELEACLCQEIVSHEYDKKVDRETVIEYNEANEIERPAGVVAPRTIEPKERTSDD